MKLFNNKRGAFSMEKLGWMRKQVLFLIIVFASALYIFEFTSGILKAVVEYRLDEPFSFIAVRNILGVFLFILFVLFYLNQIDYNNIMLIGWTATYYLFVSAIVATGAYLFEPTNEIIRFFVDFRLDFFPIISIRNALGIIMFILSYKIWKTIKP